MKNFLFASLVFFLVFMGVFVTTFSFWGEYSGWVADSDYSFHLARASGECPANFYSWERCVNYSPLYSMLTRWMNGDEFLFNLFNIVLLVFIIPAVLYFSTRSDWSYIIYFSSVFVFNIMYASIFAHALLALIFVLILVSRKTLTFWNGALFALGLFAHSQAPYVLLPLFIFKIYEDYRGPIDRYLSFVGAPFVIGPLLSDDALRINHLIMLAPPFSWYYSGFLSLSKNVLILVFFIGGIAVNYRAILFIPLLWSFWLPSLIARSKHKWLLLAVSLAYLLIQFKAFFIETTFIPKIV